MDFASLTNFHERLVFDYIASDLLDRYPEQDEDFFLDVACYALNRLPGRYIRHEIDMVYFLGEEERAEIEDRVTRVVDDAAAFIQERSRE
jgi:hypothetical protein